MATQYWVALLLLVCGVMIALSRHEGYWLLAVPALFCRQLDLGIPRDGNLLLATEDRHWIYCGPTCSEPRASISPALSLHHHSTEYFLAHLGFVRFGVAGIAALFPLFKSNSIARTEDVHVGAVSLKTYGDRHHTGIGGWLLQSADRWVVEHFFHGEDVGLFALASNSGMSFPQWQLPH